MRRFRVGTQAAVALSLVWILLLCAPTGAAPSGRGDEGGEQLREAALAGDLAKVRSLLDSGVPANAPAPRWGQTPLQFAAQKGHEAIVRLLLERGADVNARESFFGGTPLGSALGGGHLELARLLLEKGARQADEALETALEKDDLELARAALASGFVLPLDLKAAQRQADSAGKAAMKELLAAAVVKPVPHKIVEMSPEKLNALVGRYKAGAREAVVSIRGKGLALSVTGDKEIVFDPIGENQFETADGNAAMSFGGRGGSIEWGLVNQDGEILRFGLVTSDPQPLKKADGTALPVAPRGEPKPWPQFRGPAASGIGDGQGIPATWNVATRENIRFKTPLPGIALSSPIVWGDRIFVTTAISASGDSTFRTGLYGDGTSVDDLSEHSFRLVALDTRTGAVQWEREVHKTRPTVRRHLKSSLANATPVTDGRKVVVLFGAVGVLAAYDFTGEKLWQRDVGVLDCNDPQAGVAEWGHASSPILHDGLVILQGDRRKDSFLAAYKLATGEEVWRVPRDETSTWATPNVLVSGANASERMPAELVTNGRTVRAYDPKNGKLLWTLGPNSEVVVATPVVGDGKVFITAGYPPVRPIYAIRPGAHGDLTLPAGQSRSDTIVWSHQRGGTYIPTPLLYQGHLYLVNNNGLLTCYNAATGEQVYQTRIGEAGASFSASPIAADGRIYFPSETGEVYVLRAGPSFELLATNDMDETLMATPAASDGLLVVRTLGHIVGISQSQPVAAVTSPSP